MKFSKLRKGHYLAEGNNGSGYEIIQSGWWSVFRLENIENQDTAERINEFRHFKEAKDFARSHNKEGIDLERRY